MLRFRGTVQYADGREETFEAGSAAQADYELYALRHGWPIGDGQPPMLWSLLIAHSALKVPEGFELWRESVSGIELEADGVPPTQEDQSAG
jgi:hypothetical protein